MLVHAITNNNMSSNNQFVSEIITDPRKWNEIDGGNNYISSSLISDKYMVTYGIPNNNDTVMFGFNNLPGEAVRFTSLSDVGIERNATTNMDYTMLNKTLGLNLNVNTVTTVDDLMEKTIEMNQKIPPNQRLWTEIGLLRTDPTTGLKIKPDYVVCMDTISENAIQAANKFNIPIYLINRSYYSELPYNNYDVSVHSTESLYDDKTTNITDSNAGKIVDVEQLIL